MKIVYAFLILLFSCSNSDTYSQHQLWNMAKKVEPKIEILIPKTINDGVKCSDYEAGCLGGKRVKLRLVVLTVVEFETAQQAEVAARAIGQYYVRNWVLDNVTGEPVLEDFVKKAFNAKKASLDDIK